MGKRCLPIPSWLKDRLTREKVDYLDVENSDCLIKGNSADWSEKLLKEDGLLCSYARVFFDSANAGGTKPWSSEAHGAIVVALRGQASWEEMARNAESVGAVAVVVVDNEVKLVNDWVMTLDEERSPIPSLPMLVV